MSDRRKWVVLAVLLAFVSGCQTDNDGAASTRAAMEPTTTAATTVPARGPVAAVWYEMTYPPTGESTPRRLIVGVWGDGTVVWSDNRRTGGKPYHTGRISPDLVNKLLKSLDAVGYFALPRGGHFGPDASITVIAADSGQHQQRLGSWHDPPTTRPRLLIDQRGISSLPPAEPRPKPSPEYARFLEVWAESRRLIESVVPEEHGRPQESLDDEVFKLGRK